MTKNNDAQHNEGEGLKPRLLDVEGLSRYIAMPKASIYTYVSLGKIPASCIRRIGRALKFDREAIDAWVSGEPSGSCGESSPLSKTKSDPTSRQGRQGAASPRAPW